MFTRTCQRSATPNKLIQADGSPSASLLRDIRMAKWWLVSWTTYGTWLPGDTRGYCTWRGRQYIAPPERYAKPGESKYVAAEHSATRQIAEALDVEPVHFSVAEKQTAIRAMVDEISGIAIAPAIISVGRWHVHWLCYFGTLEIRKVVGRVKAAATRELNLEGFVGKRPWAKGCNMKSKATRQACRAAYRYIARHDAQECLIYKWKIDPNYLRFK
jgi:hypothetical protein